MGSERDWAEAALEELLRNLLATLAWAYAGARIALTSWDDAVRAAIRAVLAMLGLS